MKIEFVRLIKQFFQIALPVALVLTTGCSAVGNMLKLKNELKVLNNQIQLISGFVVNRSGHSGNTVAVMLLPDAGAPGGYDIAAYKTLQNDDERFVFSPEENGAIVAAFVDSNNDHRRNDDEPLAIISRPLKSGFTVDQTQWKLNKLVLRAGIPPASELLLDVTNEHLRSRLDSTRNIGRITDFDDEHFDAVNVRMGLWEPIRFSREVGYGFYLLEPWNPEKDILLLVHGVNGSPQVWRDLAPQLNLDKFQIVLFHYPSGLPLETSATVLSDVMSEMHLRVPGKRVRVIAHSMGGLIALRYIQLQDQRGFVGTRLDHFMSIATPWAGHKAAEAGVNIAPVVVPVWHDMVPNSQFLADLQTVGLPEKLPDYSLLFSYSGPRRIMTENNDGAVTLESQLTYSMQSKAAHLYGLDENHNSVVASSKTAELINQLALSE